MKWWQAFRFHFVPPSFLPAILGGVVAWSLTAEFHGLYFLLTVIGVTINHISLNMTDDYYDFIHSVDQAKDREKNPYSGGSSTLTTGLITPGQMYRVSMVGYMITIVIGLFLAYFRGWEILIFGSVGVLSAYFYTAPPIRYGYHGFGEVSQLVNFSIIIGLGSYFVMAKALSWEMVLAVLPLGFMMFAMITINEIPDVHMDRAGGKGTLVVKFGTTTAVKLYTIAMAAAYLVILIGPLLRLTSFWLYITLVTVPWFYKARHILIHHYADPVRLAPANMYTIKIHNIVGILSIIAYMIQGIVNNGTPGPLWIPLVTLIVLYLPVALIIFFGVLPINVAGTDWVNRPSAEQ
ncbi:1,4-dihydroxy-2-naphthoate octaprenyltransferase [candidate division KSB1 bacterium]|nr:1,4-dihydroxy-2-naphthoate octaprenyltransferase [candidate division KSB1 bacterium]